MALSGIQIYKMLPQTNCKECGFPTCLAFAMKLAAKQVELSSCPYVSEESKKQLAESAAPPIRLVTLKAGTEVKAGNPLMASSLLSIFLKSLMAFLVVLPW
jgi:acetyl-CoA decarbonylase/synthase complex subunit gamma